GPLLAGTIISNMKTNIGYMTIFSMSFTLFNITVILSFFIQRWETDGIYNVKTYIQQINNNRNWFNNLLANLYHRISAGIFIFVISIWIFLTTNDEFSLGIFNLLMHGSSFIVFLLLTWLLKDSFRKRFIFISSIVIAFSVVILMFELHFYLLLIYALVI